MFTGIVEEIGRVDRVVRRKGAVELTIRTRKVRAGLKLGSSVSVNGVCLTVSHLRKEQFTVSVVPETLTKTSLGILEKGSPVNMERALRIGDRLNGHWVSGHVDGVAQATRFDKLNADVRLTFRPPRQLMRYVALKGSITVEGVSLTVAGITAREVTVALVPFTLQQTTLGRVTIGDLMNLEVDVLARYAEKLQLK